MSHTGELKRITDENVGEIVGAEHGALVLAKEGCGHCAAYEREILELSERDELGGVAVGKMVLDAPGSRRFKSENSWLSELEFLPYTVLYRRGRPVDGFAASKGAYLAERVGLAGWAS